ncbi:RNA methyltransferase [soil metagenome]
MVEGQTLVAEAVAAGWELEALYVGHEAPTDVVDVLVDGVAWHRLAPGVLERVASTETPQAMLASVRMRTVTLEDIERVALIVAVDRVADPGNLGTVLRSAEAAGAGAVVTTPGTVDVFNPKVVRASAGALFHLPLVSAELAELASTGRRLLGSSSHRGTPHTDVDWSGPLAIVVGNEAGGLDDDAPVSEWVRIEHRGRSESLNVAMAATVLCFEAARPRDASR